MTDSNRGSFGSKIGLDKSGKKTDAIKASGISAAVFKVAK